MLRTVFLHSAPVNRCFWRESSANVLAPHDISPCGLFRARKVILQVIDHDPHF